MAYRSLAVAVLGVGFILAASVAQADPGRGHGGYAPQHHGGYGYQSWGHYRHHHHPHYGWGPRVYYAPPPVYYYGYR